MLCTHRWRLQRRVPPAAAAAGLRRRLPASQLPAGLRRPAARLPRLRPSAQLPAAARAGVRAEHHITAGHGRVLRCLVSPGILWVGGDVLWVPRWVETVVVLCPGCAHLVDDMICFRAFKYTTQYLLSPPFCQPGGPVLLLPDGCHLLSWSQHPGAPPGSRFKEADLAPAVCAPLSFIPPGPFYTSGVHGRLDSLGARGCKLPVPPEGGISLHSLPARRRSFAAALALI